MIVDRKWVERNLGFDPNKTPAPAATFTVKAAAKPSATVESLQREIIDFDSEAPEGKEFLAFTTATGLSRFTDIPWPGLAPKTDKVARKGNRSAFISKAVLHYVESRGKENLRERLKQEALANHARDLEIAAEWFPLEEEASEQLDAPAVPRTTHNAKRS